LADEENKEYIAWLPHGRAWKILKQHDFEEKVIPLYFRHAKLASFMRQVNGWGFRRAPAGPDQNAYHHEMFLRGYPQLCAKMRRPMHKVRSQAPSNSEQPPQPNFHDSTVFHPLDEKVENGITSSSTTTRLETALPQPSSDRKPPKPSNKHKATATSETVKGKRKKLVDTQSASKITQDDREESNSDLCASDGDDDASDDGTSDDEY
jgi:HSF-type DNA-binding